VQRTEAGYQNALVYVVFLASIVVAAAWAVPGTPVRLLRWIVAGAVLGACGYLVTVAAAGAGSDGFYLARGVGVVAWIGMVAAVPLAASSRKALLACAVLVVACALSLSRTSTAVCLLLALAIVIRPDKRVPVRLLLAWSASLVGCAALAVAFFAPLRDRFLRNDNESIAGLPIGSSGRVNIWREVWESIQQSPLYGHGTGTAQRLVSGTFGENYIAHPHNEYLRLWHDFGIAGLALWLAGMWLLGSGAFRRWRSARSPHDQAAHLAAVLALVGLAASITTGNMLIQVFVAVPIGIVIGTSLGRDPVLEQAEGGDRTRSLTHLQPSERTAPGR
jgi:O-Antigen ligase